MLTPVMITANLAIELADTWTAICPASRIMPFSGVAALVNAEQVAVFRLASSSECYAISNYDPFSQAFVISRGLVGDKGGTLKVASPIYKHTFNLLTGQCFEDETIRLQTWLVRVIDGIVQIAI